MIELDVFFAYVVVEMVKFCVDMFSSTCLVGMIGIVYGTFVINEQWCRRDNLWNACVSIVIV